jgi:hypothetical protein
MRIFSLDDTLALTLPISGAVAVGADLPPEVDVEILKQELSRFYDDRFWVAESPAVVAEIVTPEIPKTTRSRKQR